MRPSADQLLSTARVVSLPLTTRFRGVDVREAVLFEGAEGWSEFSPFTEYADAEAATWLAAAIDFGWNSPPPPLRDSIMVNATLPAVPPDQVTAVLDRFPAAAPSR
jgi:O-succinylbenzoate synthase